MSFSMLNDTKSLMKIGIPKETISNENRVAPAWLPLDTEWNHIQPGRVITRTAVYRVILWLGSVIRPESENIGAAIPGFL